MMMLPPARMAHRIALAMLAPSGACARPIGNDDMTAWHLWLFILYHRRAKTGGRNAQVGWSSTLPNPGMPYACRATAATAAAAAGMLTWQRLLLRITGGAWTLHQAETKFK